MDWVVEFELLHENELNGPVKNNLKLSPEQNFNESSYRICAFVLLKNLALKVSDYILQPLAEIALTE